MTNQFGPNPITPDLNPTNQLSVPKLKQTPAMLGFAKGGLVTGNGGPTSDNISAKLSPGEYVIPADVVSSNKELIS